MDAFIAASEVVDIVQVVRDAGTVGLLVLVIVSGARGWWVFGHTYRDMKAERDTWRAHTMKSAKHAEAATTIAEVFTKAQAELAALAEIEDTK